MYVDNDTNEILNQVPQKKQSAFVRDAVKEKFLKMNNTKEEPTIIKQKPRVRIIG